MNTRAGEVVVITGASEGIGRALALDLARRNARLVLAARSAERLGKAAEACRQAGAEILTVVTDVSREDDCRALMEQTVGQFGRIDTLVANAGRTMWARFEEIERIPVCSRRSWR